MKLFLASTAAFTVFIASLLGINGASQPTVTSIRAFEEPLVAIGGDGSENHDSALVAALQAFQKRKSYEDVSVLTTYLDANAQSPWRFSLLANLGIIYRKAGYYSQAVNVWEKAWALGKGEKDVEVQALSNRIAGELSTLLSSLGRVEQLELLLNETKGRTAYGSANVLLSDARANLYLMKKKPGESFKCGPYALDSIRTFENKGDAHHKLIMEAQSSTKGFSLTQVRDLSNALKMNYQMARRHAGADFIVPSVIHWKSGHFAALLKKEGDRYLTKDPTFGQEILVTAGALEDESSGYFLVPSGPLPSGWESVTDAEGQSIWGQGVRIPVVIGATSSDDKKTPQSSCHGMATYDVFLMLVSLSIQDNPVGYTPPVGPDAQFTVTYNQLEATQPATFTFFNFGPSWNCNWLSYVVPPTSSGGTAYVNTRGGGQETYNASTYTSTTAYTGYVGYYGNQAQSNAVLWVTNSAPATYERRLPDGSKEVFGIAQSGVGVFLTKITDPRGNSLSMGYDTTSSYFVSTGYLRLTSVTDALGSLSTTLTYGLSADPLKVTQITDPYGRSANFTYSTSAPYQLASITDVIGITSSFTYGTGSAITELTTPYGNTHFSFTESGSEVDGGVTYYAIKSLTVTEPDSSQIKVESRLDGSDYPTLTESAPTGFGFTGYSYSSLNPNLIPFRNTYFWDKKAMQSAPTDYSQSHIYHWLHTADATAVSPILESEKPAMENRIWYTYPGQVNTGYSAYTPRIFEGTSATPTAIVRVVSDPTHPQAWQYQYTNTANPASVTAVIDPTGRQTNYTYDTATGIDLTGVTQNTGSGTDTLKTITYNNSLNPPHCPASVTDAAGQTTAYTYNSQGQVLTVTPPVRSGHSAETTTYGYTGNYLTTVTGPLSGAVTTYTYDTLGGHRVNRVKTKADAESYTLTYSYDNLDRLTQIAYPDSTTEAFSFYNPLTSAVDLDLHYSTDRVGQTTYRSYDSTRHLTSVTDPKTQTTNFTWCSCGSMTSMTDARTNTTYFNYDVESRLTSKVYPGGTQPPASPDYTYDTVGRVATFTDKRGDVANYSYNLDNTVSGISYSLASSTATTPNVSYGYDANYNRVTSVGGVSLTYEPVGSLGALKPYVVTSTLAGGSAAIAYTYDEWGRVVGRNIDGADNETTAFDPLGRVSSVTNLLCPGSTSFSYSYFDPTHPTNRVGTISYPNGQSTVYNYFSSTGDERLQEIKNLTPTSTVLSQNDYTYSADGKISTWQQQTDNNTPLLWNEGYDAADQLTSAVLTNTSITSPAVRSDSYSYDATGNPTTFNISGVSRSPSYNSLNQLTGSTPSGNRTVGFTGLLNGAATVTVNGSAATVNGSHYFSGTASLTTGTTAPVPIVATDVHGNVRTNNYQQVVPAELTYTPTYDADGNELTNGAGQTYTWDAKNELASIAYTGGASTAFTYDALDRRIKIVDVSGGTTTTKQLVWNGRMIAEERNASNAQTKEFFAQGERIGSTSYYYSRDHLGSVREMTDSSGNIQARYDYDPYGRASLIQGTLASDFQYAGYYEHALSGLNLTLFRAYDPNTAKWLSRDPLGERMGPNLYNYVVNDPLKFYDPLGLCSVHSVAVDILEISATIEVFAAGLVVISVGLDLTGIGSPEGLTLGAFGGAVLQVNGYVVLTSGFVAQATAPPPDSDSDPNNSGSSQP